MPGTDAAPASLEQSPEQGAARMWQSMGKLLEHSTNAFIALDRAWRVIYLNGVAEGLLERERAAPPTPSSTIAAWASGCMW